MWPLVGQIVYQDTFDDDGLDVNLGIGGGGSAFSFNGNEWGWEDNGDLSAGTAASGNRVTNFSSNNSFDLSRGFTLEVVFNMEFNDNNGSGGTVPFNSNHFSFGLSSTTPTQAGNGFFTTDSEQFPADAVGFSLGTRSNTVTAGLLEANGATGDISALSPFNATLGDDQTIVLTVNPDGTFDYTYGLSLIHI